MKHQRGSRKLCPTLGTAGLGLELFGSGYACPGYGWLVFEEVCRAGAPRHVSQQLHESQVTEWAEVLGRGLPIRS